MSFLLQSLVCDTLTYLPDLIEAGSSAGVDSIFSAAISDADLPHPSAPIDRPGLSDEKVMRWMQRGVDSVPGLPTPVGWSSSPPMINILGVNNNKYQGDWLA